MIRINEAWRREVAVRTRMPFRYGIAAMTEAPHAFVRVVAEVDGQRCEGIAADLLPPKWFTKDPNTLYEQDLPDLRAVADSACSLAVELGPQTSVFRLWRELYAAQQAWAAPRKLPPLLWHFGVSLVERAAIDAACRAMGSSFAEAVRRDRLGLDLGDVRPELEGMRPTDYLPTQPLRRIAVRHTVGLSDPLTDADIAAGERLDDGLPQSLEASVRAYGLTRFKIKIGGDAQRDRERLRAIADLLDRVVGDYAFTLDGNEQYRSIDALRELWASLQADARTSAMLRKLIFIEQPLHRDVALEPEVGAALRAWPDRPAIIIDESDATLDSLPRALELGYAGTSHKNCKGVFKGLANAALLAARRRAHPGATFVQSAEDLSNLGPVALQQDLAVVATLGIDHAERNGHHYFRGLSGMPEQLWAPTLAAHGDLYARHAEGFPTVKVSGGSVDVSSVVAAPFGVAIEPAAIAG